MRLLQYITLYLRLVSMYRTLERVRRMSEVDYVERNQVRLYHPQIDVCIVSVVVVCRWDTLINV